MSDEDKLGTAIDRAHRAARLMDDELLNETLAYMRDYYLKEWQNTKPSETLKREKHWVMISHIEFFKTILATVLANGKLAQAQIDQRERLRRT